jgi:protein-S-isoprenylcysteine O-methyltransferase Ste14
MITNNPSEGKKSNKIKSIIMGFLALSVMITIMLLLAGRIDFWQAWLFATVNLIIILVLFTAFSGMTKLIKERMKPGVGTKRWDKIFWMLYGPMNLMILIIASLDAGRFYWSPNFPAIVYVLAYGVYLLANFIHLWAIVSNDFYTSTVRIQEERGQVVVDKGPYRFIRHPGYLGILLMLLCMALVLGSLYALIPYGVVFLLLIIRTYLEDNTLKEELDGYKAFTKKTRFRLIPGIW